MHLREFHQAYSSQTDPKHGRGIWKDVMRQLDIVHSLPWYWLHALKRAFGGFNPARFY